MKIIKGVELLSRNPVSKTLAKKLPFGLGLAVAGGLATARFKEGDKFGGALELASGIASIIPLWGTLISALIDLGLFIRDLNRTLQIFKYLKFLSPFNWFNRDRKDNNNNNSPINKVQKVVEKVKNSPIFKKVMKVVEPVVEKVNNSPVIKKVKEVNSPVVNKIIKVTGMNTSSPNDYLIKNNKSFSFSSPYGWRKDPITGKVRWHNGYDYSAVEGTPVQAQLPGRVIIASKGWNGGLGNFIKMETGEGETLLYAHMKDINVRSGQTVQGGVNIGTVGHTGRSTGPHLHYEASVKGKSVNPNSYIDSKLKNEELIEEKSNKNDKVSSVEEVTPIERVVNNNNNNNFNENKTLSFLNICKNSKVDNRIRLISLLS